MTGEPLRRGDAVRVSLGEDAVDATVLMASVNGRSLVLGIDGGFMDYVGILPLFQGDDGGYRDLILGRALKLERVS